MNLTSRLLRCALLVLLAALGCAGKQTRPAGNPSAPVDDHTQIQGTWQVASAEADGQPTDKIADAKFAITGDRMATTTSDKTEVLIVTLRPEKSPKEFDLAEPDSGKVVVLGIYRLEGDTFTISWIGDSGRRPTDFATSTATSGHTTAVLKRSH